ncbi:MAG: hypothetical protein JO207_04805 [Verrucomicrobia bacterium]|nr:hypothetical protein [Verrucomicrobiota bacterium]
MLVFQVNRWLGFTKTVGRDLPERGNPLLIWIFQESLLGQRCKPYNGKIRSHVGFINLGFRL